MIGTSSLSGDTLIACRFPVVQLPTWHPVQALCGSTKRTNRLCPVGLTRAVSLPEQDSLSREHTVTVCRRHFSNSYGSLNEERTEEEGASDSSGRYDSNSSPEDTSCHVKNGSNVVRGSLRLHNSFLPNTDLDEDEEDEDIDGDNLHRYHEDSSFVLQGNSNWPISNEGASYAISPRDVDSEWGNEGTMLGTRRGQQWLSNHLDSQPPNCQCFQRSRSGMTLMACLDEDSNRLKDHVTCRIHKHSPDRLSNDHTDYVSDSSCNSSDGVLVNFCTIYNRSNNPATPHDLSSPALHPSQSSEGSVFLNLQPVSQDPATEGHSDGKTVHEEGTMAVSASRWSPQGLDSNCNLYSLEPLPPGLSSLEVSDLAACLQSQATLAVGTNQKYYKLVTCDLSSQSPSPACSSLTNGPEGPGRSSPFLLSLDHKTERQHSEAMKEKDGQHKEITLLSSQSASGMDCSLLQKHDYQVATTSTAKALCRRKHADGIQSFSHSPCSPCPNQSGPHNSKWQDTRAVSTQLFLREDLEHGHVDDTETGVGSAENMIRYSKAQRPTSLPIQPFVLVPSGKPQSQAQHLGCLLEQYINKKNSKSSSLQSGLKFNGKSNQCLSNLQLSPVESHFPVVLEAPTSSDTCSTCTPTPDCFTYKRMWGHPNRNQACPSPCTSKISQTSQKATLVQAQDKPSPSSSRTQNTTFLNPTSALHQPGLVRIPTYQDLINLTPKQGYTSPKPKTSNQSKRLGHSVLSHTPPTLPLTTDALHPDRQVSQTPPSTTLLHQKCPQYGATPAADSSISHNSFTAALSSVAPLSSLSSLFSLVASGLHPQQIQDSAGPALKPGQSRQSESLILSDRPPTEFCLSPDTSYESMSISHLQRRGLLRSVSRAVDLIMAHFGSSRDPEEKMRLGNSSCSPTIAGLVLEHLCPALQNILEDGLRDHKLDVIVGQRRNHSWSVVEISTKIGPSTRVLQSLVSKIRLCPQLTSHCMRLRAFIMGLLNLRALEFWLSHLQSQKDVVTTSYHSWGFLPMSLGCCQPLFQELLLLLQPLSVLPFDLNLLLEPRLLHQRQLCSGDQRISPQPCSALLATSWPRLQVNKVDRIYSSQRTMPSPLQGTFTPQNLSFCNQRQQGDIQAKRSPVLAAIPEWWPKEHDPADGVAEGEDCSKNNSEAWFHISMDSRQEESREDRESGIPAVAPEESPGQGGLRWAKLFGATDWSIRAETTSQSHIEAPNRRKSRPSQWLHLDRSQLGLLAQSIKSLKLGGPRIKNHF